MTYNQNLEERIERIISSMTVKEKVGQLNQVPFDDIHNEGIEQKIENGEIGSLILSWGAYAGNVGQQATSIKRLNEIQKISVEKSKSKIPLLFGRDVIHGHHTVFPIPLAMAASFNPELVEESYSCIAKEATSEGIKWTFTPMIDLARDPRWGRVVEGCGEDPYLAGIMAKSMITGLQGDDYSQPDKMAACAKHYIGYGASEGGRDYHKTEISDYTLRNFHLPAFKSAVDSGVATVMSAFNEISGQPVTSSEYLINGLLKTELGFDGFVISDYGAIEQLEMQGVAESREKCAELAINAGIDMDMADDCYSENLEKLVNEGKVKMSVLDEAVRRVLRIKARCGLLDCPYLTEVTIDRTEHKKLAKKLASESIVLLKNSDNILPLDKSGEYGLMGPMSKDKKNHFGAWVIDGKYEEIISVEEAILAKVTDGNNISVPDCDMICDALYTSLARDTVIVVCGDTRKSTGEFRGRANIDMPQEQTELLKSLKAIGKKVVAVMCFGRPVAMEEAEKYCDAILYSWHSGTMAGAAIADVLFGDVCPSGKLPITLPRSTGQIPIYYNVPSSGRPVNGYYEELRNYIDLKSTPMYPFGYGLSYTEFEYSEVKANDDKTLLSDLDTGKKIKISAYVKNTGDVDAKTVVQCYVRDKVSKMTRPLRELKGFKKVHIKKNESVEVEFELGKNELGYYNSDGNFEVEKGTFDVYIGADCYAECMCTIQVV